ncbi:SagB/ThcOx family dehydrogenase [Sphingomonas parva]|nr:SagB/ThcOx family dehydrogenase [Sphingomonas parva]
MSRPLDMSRWERAAIGQGAPDLLWEWFHENSKTGRFDPFPTNDAVVAEMQARLESLDYASYPLVALPQTRTPLAAPLDEVLAARESARGMAPGPVTLEQLGSLLFWAYGVTRDNVGTVHPRPFRTIPSGGGLYPLELYFHSSHVEGLAPGLYHYSAAHHHLRRLAAGDHGDRIAAALVQPELAASASIVFFVTAMFERSTFKYRDRGYRFVFLEAGHLGQNLTLAAIAMGLKATSIGGFFDRDVDKLLHIDGINHSSIYLCAVGHPEEP